VAVLPVRCPRTPLPGAAALAAAVGERLVARLESLGWSRIMGPEEAAQALAAAGLNAMNLEFEPARASSRLGWTAVVAGYLEPDSASSYTRGP